MSEYAKYFLADNPFPSDPIVDPSSRDPRQNGSIFNVEIRQRELQELAAKLDSKLGLIYLLAPINVRGMGKSAILVHQWKRLQTATDITSVYVNALQGRATPRDFIDNVVRAWHENGYLWQGLKDLLKKQTVIPQDVVDDIFASYPEMPPRIDLGRYLYKGSIRARIRELADWAASCCRRTLYEILEAYFRTYLSVPPDFLRTYASERKKIKGCDEIDCFRSILELLRNSRYVHHYVFLDQFEYAIKSVGKGNKLINFCSDMRRILEAGTGYITLSATLHLDASNLLNIPECSPLTELAPPSPRYVVRTDALDADQTRKLAVSYLECFRGKYSPPEKLYPFDEDSLTYIRDEFKGIVRRILKALHFAIEEGRQSNFIPITKDFLYQKHVQILDRAATEVEM